MCWRSRIVLLVLVGFVFASGCRRNHRDGETTGSDASMPVPFEVRVGQSDLAYFWFDEHGNAHSVEQIEQIPSAMRSPVRVDPMRPELRTPGWVYIADLRSPGADGRYAVRAEPSERFASELAASYGLPHLLGPAGRPPTGGGGGGAGGAAAAGSPTASVVIYGASWCSACHQAAAWMRSQGIAFVERDIEQDPAAQQELFQLARQQNVPTGSIPIINVNGRLFVGFNPVAIQQALRGS